MNICRKISLPCYNLNSIGEKIWKWATLKKNRTKQMEDGPKWNIKSFYLVTCLLIQGFNFMARIGRRLNSFLSPGQVLKFDRMLKNTSLNSRSLFQTQKAWMELIRVKNRERWWQLFQNQVISLTKTKMNTPISSTKCTIFFIQFESGSQSFWN